jgi:hypothetical protein
MRQMHELEEKVWKELEGIGEKGLTSSNLDTTFKLIDIYKDIKEAKYYEAKTRHYEKEDWSEVETISEEGLDEQHKKYLERMKRGLCHYKEGVEYYHEGKSTEKMLDGVEMTMDAVVKLVELLVDFAETD